MKKILSGIAAILMLTVLSMSAFAADTSMGSDAVTVEIEGRVQPLTIAATVSINTYLSIDPNQPESNQFVSPIITVTNDCNAPLTLYALSMKATGSAPKVVSQSKFTDEEWKQLSKSETLANIALGLTDKGIDNDSVNMWFAEESAQTSTMLCHIPYQGEHLIKLQGKFGRTWEQSATYKYAMTVKIGLMQ